MENHTLEESTGPSKQAAPDYMAHIVMLTEKVNALRRRTNEGRQKWRDDPVHILDISSDEDEELIPARVALPPPSHASETAPPSVLVNQSLEGCKLDSL